MKCQLKELGMLQDSEECADNDELIDCIGCSWYIDNKTMLKKKTAAKRFVPLADKDYKNAEGSVAKLNHKLRIEKLTQILRNRNVIL